MQFWIAHVREAIDRQKYRKSTNQFLIQHCSWGEGVYHLAHTSMIVRLAIAYSWVVNFTCANSADNSLICVPNCYRLHHVESCGAAMNGFVETLKNPCVFVEDVWKTCGRRAHLLRFGSEDVNLSKGNTNKYYFLLLICVFQGNMREVYTSSRRLPDVFQEDTCILYV